MKATGPRRKGAATSSAAASGITPEMLALRPGALWRAFWAERFAYIAISIYLLLEYLKLDQAYPIFGILPFVRLSLLAALVGFFFDTQAKIPGSFMNWLLVLLLVHCVISSVYAYDPAYSYSYFNVIGLWVLVYFLIVGIVTTERRLYLFLAVYLLANLKMSQFGFFTWMKRGFGFASWGLTGAGWFKNSGELGLEMSMFFAYTVCFALFLRKYWAPWPRRVMYFMTLSAAACVVASSSRGAVIGVIAVLFYLSFFSKQKVRAWLVSASFICLGYFFMPVQFLARFQTAGEDATSLSRIYYWEKAKEMLHQHPYLGVGYYNWVPYYRDHYFNPQLYWRLEEAHNTYLQLGAEIGYIGLGIFIGLVSVSFLINWSSERLARRPGLEFLRALSLGMNAAGMGLVFASIFLTSFFMPNYWIHFALTVALRNVIRKKIAPVREFPKTANLPLAARR